MENLPGRSWLIVALSARALAVSASRAGLSVIALDLYNDVDTRACAQKSRAVAGNSLPFSAFDGMALLQAADEICPASACTGVVAGSGFEDQPCLLRQLCTDRRLFGNAPGTVLRLKDPRSLMPLLDRIGLPHPETSVSPPRDASGWLVKHAGGNGGSHIRSAARARVDLASEYFQRIETGQACSVTFLANGKRAWIIGFNRQRSVRIGDSEFCYAGALGHVQVPQNVELDIRLKLDRLVTETGLVGLNGMDFLVREDDYSVLEINPRPSATLDLYDEDYEQGLFACHLAACDGILPESACGPQTFRAHAVIYAERPFVTPADFEFPGWCSDVPHAGTRFAPGEPICMVHAAAHDRAEATRILRSRETVIEQALGADNDRIPPAATDELAQRQ